MSAWEGETPKYLLPHPNEEDAEFWQGARRGARGGLAGDR